ncbi:MAG: hypothetical protein MK188_05220 [Gammaproteobacteria bacterium]|nr:hypothetical protein [Gammaproteobacteria bacterium]
MIKRSIATFIVFLSVSTCLFSVKAEQVSAENDQVHVVKNITLSEDASPPRDETAKQYHDQIAVVLSHTDFSQKKTVTKWRWIDTENEVERQEKFPEWIINWLEFMESNQSLIASIAGVIEIILWCLLVLSVIFVVLRYQQLIVNFVAKSMTSKDKVNLPSSLFGIDMREDEIPEDVVSSAQNLWGQEEIRRAIALLLKASLIKIINSYNIGLSESYTEIECCEHIDRSAPADISQLMRLLVEQWQQIAYAHKQPSEKEFKQLCIQWNQAFKNDNKRTEERSDAN